MKLAFIYGKWSSQIHGSFEISGLYRNKGLTGSESYLFNTIHGLAALGHEVTAFCDCVNEVDRAENLGGARIRKLASIDVATADYDAVLSWNEPDQLRSVKPGVPRICTQQLNDFGYCQPGFDAFVDVYVCPSQTHLDYITTRYPELPKSKFTVISNCINLEFYDCVGQVERDPNRIVYCSSPDRGLHWLLELFPKVRREIPEATLKVYYKVSAWIDHLKGMYGDWGPKNAAYEDCRALATRARYLQECLNRLGTHGENGVTLVENIPNVEMARELAAATVLAYPCDPINFTEGFSVTILDACAAGCVPIISDVDAIGSVYKDVAHIIPGRPRNNKDAWISTIVHALRDAEFRKTITDRAQAFAKKQSRQLRAKEWEVLLASKVKPPPTPAVVTSAPPKQLRAAFLLHPRTVRDPFDVEGLWSSPRGLTGSEVSLFLYAEHLARLGHDATVFSNFKKSGRFGKLTCLPYDQWENTYVRQPWDAACAWTLPDPLERLSPSTFRLLCNQCGNFDRPGWEQHVDLLTVLSNSQARVLEKQTSLPKEKWKVLHNVVDTSRFQPAEKVPGKIIWASSHDRGLHRLLQMMPEVRKAVPNAHLHVFYDPYSVNYAALEYTAANKGCAWWSPQHEELGNRARFILDALDTQTKSGLVTLHRSVSREAIEREMGTASVLAYSLDPVYFTETFGVVVLEACASGTAPLLCADDAFQELWGDAAECVPPPFKDHKDEFFGKLVRLLVDSTHCEKVASRCRARAGDFEVSKLVKGFETCLLTRGASGLNPVNW